MYKYVHISKITRETHRIEWRNPVVIQVWNATRSVVTMRDRNIYICPAHYCVL